MVMQYDDDKLYEMLKKSEYISISEQGVNEQINNGIYKLYSDEASFIKNFIGFDNDGYEGFIEVVNQKVLSAQDCSEEILNRVFAVRIADIPDSEDKREEIAVKHGFFSRGRDNFLGGGKNFPKFGGE